MQRTVFFFTLSLAAMLAHAQLTLEECQRRAQDNYPLVRQYGLIEKARGYDLSNAGEKATCPSFPYPARPRTRVTSPGYRSKSLISTSTPASKDQYQVMLKCSRPSAWVGIYVPEND